MKIDRTVSPVEVAPEDLASWIKLELQTKSQSQLAKDLSTTPQTIKRWKEGSIGNLYYETIDIIAKYRNVDRKTLIMDLTKSINKKSNANAYEKRLDSLESEIAKLRRLISHNRIEPLKAAEDSTKYSHA
jgi:transcriptional regulator with XRE-family HTH domain